MSQSSFSITPSKNMTAIFVTFSGRQLGMATLTFFEFRNFLQENFSKYNQHFFVDKKTLWYTKGIEDISTNIDETLEYLKQLTEGYEHVIFIGASMGGYAALLYGSLLNVDHVIAFRPQTIISNELNPAINLKENPMDLSYYDIRKVINPKTEYHIYGDSSITDPNDIHSFEYCKRLIDFSNVHITAIDCFDIKEYRNSGNLSADFHRILSLI